MSGFWTDYAVMQALGLRTEMPDPERVYAEVSTDTRALRPGALFVALRGERYDAHDFLPEAVARGATGLVVDSASPAARKSFDGVTVYPVPDTLVALGVLGRWRRRRLGTRCCAVTGTNGKTTTKELLAAALAVRYKVHATSGNLNNLVGVPLTLLAIPEDADVAVVELGTNAPGEIERLSELVEPDAAVITGIAEGHLEGLSDLQGVLEEKAAVLRALGPDGLAVVADEPPELADRAIGMLLKPGVAGWTKRASPELRVKHLGLDEEGRPEFHWAGHKVKLELRGRQNARNAVLAMGLARAWGVTPAEAVAAVATVQPPPMRGNVLRYGDLMVIADCYNSNPGSLDSALDLLLSIPRRGGRVAVLGSMLELGSSEADLHATAAEKLAEAELDLIVATGLFVPAFERLAADMGKRLVMVVEPLDAADLLRQRLAGNEVVLLKGSRGVALESLLEVLKDEHGPAASGTGTPWPEV